MISVCDIVSHMNLSNFAEQIGPTIRVWREQRGLSQSELARRLGTSQSAVSRWEHGHDEPRVSTLAAILRACELTGELAVGPDVDRSQIREQLALTPSQRLQALVNMSRLRSSAHQR